MIEKAIPLFNKLKQAALGIINFTASTGNLKRYRTPTVLQMEALECGAASLTMILAYYGRWVPLEEIRLECDVSRDGSKASNVLKAARKYGLKAQGYRLEPQDLPQYRLPGILHWNFNHFVVLEGFGKDKVFINDPASGPRAISYEELDEAFTGIFLEFEPEPHFEKGGERPSVFPSLLKRIGSSKSALYYITLASLALIIPGLIIPGMTKIFIDDVLVKSMQSWVMPLILGILFAAFCRAILTWLQQHILLRLETKLALASASQFFWHLIRLPIIFYTQRYSGEVLNRLGANDKIATLLAGQLGTNLVNVVAVAFYGVIMWFYDPLLTILGISLSLVNIGAMTWVARRRADASCKVLQKKSKQIGAGMSGLQMIETIKSTGGEPDFFSRWSGYQSSALIAEQQLSIVSEPLMTLPVLLNGLTTAVILGVGGLQVMDGAITIGSLIAFQTLMASFSEPIDNLVNLGGQLQEIKADIQRLDDVLNYPIAERYTRIESLEPTAGNPIKLTGEIEFRNITFGYSRLGEPLIRDFNLTIKPGARVALVGRSGSGKSTLTKIITGHYKPWSGEILIDGKPLNSIPWKVLCNSMSTVNQEIFLYEGTLYDNLTLWDNTVKEQDLIKATKDACIHDVIAARTGGYHSKVEEGGTNFSGGQRQRLEIARALVNNPSILVLDEATSALDPAVEKQIDDNIRRRGCTCLIIAHRLSTIRDSDEIIVLENGVVVERGTHDELVALKGAYWQMINIE